MKPEMITVGWREWVALPDLGIKTVKVKVDTGARTSALHAYAIKPFKKDGQHWIHFAVHPHQHSRKITKECTAKVKDIRWVIDSGGHRERRYVIETNLKIGQHSWPIELTLTNRDPMRFRMLLGRTAMEDRIIVNPAASFLVRRLRG